MDLKKIAAGEGNYVQEFLAASVCYKYPNKSDKKKCTSLDMYQSEYVEYKGVELLDMGAEGFPKLNSFINGYLAAVLKRDTYELRRQRWKRVLKMSPQATMELPDPPWTSLSVYFLCFNF